MDKSIKVDSVVGGVLSTGEVGRDIVVNNLAAEEKTTLKEAAAEIKELLDRLSSTYPTTTVEEKANVAAKAIEEIKKKPDSKAKVFKALKAGGKAALIKLTDHPVIDILVSMLESLLKDGK
ncbi:MAG: hypothetical protein F6K35_31220 [Okeania sp. SIO2H7]|nr:hypothetical protein [Okeania sp. SIO2H7]